MPKYNYQFTSHCKKCGEKWVYNANHRRQICPVCKGDAVPVRITWPAEKSIGLFCDECTLHAEMAPRQCLHYDCALWPHRMGAEGKPLAWPSRVTWPPKDEDEQERL